MIETEKDNRKMVERGILIGVQDTMTSDHEAVEHLQELRELVDTLGVPVVGDIAVKLRRINPRYLLGSGKAEEILKTVEREKADCIIFDYELSPSQQRNWEKLTGICVIDRQEVILDIFAGRASTREAVLQVELARMEYSLPRLTRAWTHLSRQRGGAKGTRGEGEQQIEVDRRIVLKRISRLQKELAEVRKHRDTQRKNRKKNLIPHAAIVGYTNAGKSSMLNALSGSDVLAEDKLFATLDPTTRKIVLPNNQEILLTDTVGFVRKLPHTLVEAFKSTLEEAALADLLILVLDISSRFVEEHWQTTLSVLEELNAADKKTITVFNKSDLVDDPVLEAHMKNLAPGGIFVSTLTGEGMEKLRSVLATRFAGERRTMKLRIPPARHDAVSFAYENGNVLSSEYEDSGYLTMTVNINRILNEKLSEFIV